MANLKLPVYVRTAEGRPRWFTDEVSPEALPELEELLGRTDVYVDELEGETPTGVTWQVEEVAPGRLGLVAVLEVEADG